MTTRGHHGVLFAATGGGGGGGGVEVLTQAFSASGSHNVNMPAAVSAGSILVAAVANGGSTTPSMVTTPSGWTSLGTVREGNNACRLSVFYKVAAGTEGGTSVDFATSASTQMAATIWHFPTGTFTGTPEATFGTGSTSSSPTPPAISPTWGAAAGTHGIVMVAFGLDTTTVSAFPYPDENKFITAGSSTYSNFWSCMTTFGGATFTPAAFTLSGSIAHVRATVALRG